MIKSSLRQIILCLISLILFARPTLGFADPDLIKIIKKNERSPISGVVMPEWVFRDYENKADGFDLQEAMIRNNPELIRHEPKRTPFVDFLIPFSLGLVIGGASILYTLK